MNLHTVTAAEVAVKRDVVFRGEKARIELAPRMYALNQYISYR